MTRLASRVLMVRPVGFRQNDETRVDNEFIALSGIEPQEAEQQALQEFDALVSALRSHGVEVDVFDHDGSLDIPDAVFPNNWFTTHIQLGGCFVLYPMRAVSRRRERQSSIIESLRSRYPTCIDLTEYENRGEYLEGTGSLILDRINRVAFLARSGRSSEVLAERWAELMGYRLLSFSAQDRAGKPIYHTNVLLSIADGYGVVCTEAIHEQARAVVLRAVEEGGRTVIELSHDQLMSFCGNVLQLQGKNSKLVVMSSRAYEAFTPDQREALAGHGELVHSEITCIESCGGGGVRCMLAELF